jgi:hypothetical protein
MRASRFDIRNERSEYLIVPSRNIGLPLASDALSAQLPSLIVSGFSLISRCTRRAHAAF